MSDATATKPNSRAVIFFRLDGGSEVLWWEGEDIHAWIREVGTDAIDLGFERDIQDVVPPREGFRVWEGWFSSTKPDADAEMIPVGTFRDLTADEWASVRAGRNPFVVAPPVDWRERDLAEARATIDRLVLQLEGIQIAARGEAIGDMDAAPSSAAWTMTFEIVKALREKYDRAVITIRSVANDVTILPAAEVCRLALETFHEPLKREIKIDKCDKPPESE